jgi:hypothetical protein
VPPQSLFVSYARNHEDVVLWRALGRHTPGSYVEVGVGDPGAGSVGRAFADRGWQALTPGGTSTNESSEDLHFLAVSAPAAVPEALRGIDLRRSRPWVLVVAANSPTAARGAWEDDLRAAGYEFCLFDGVSRFYVAAEHADELRGALSHPACALDDFVSPDHLAALERAEDLLVQATHWRTLALTQWADALATLKEHEDDDAERDLLREEVRALQRTLSWRVTLPLRKVRPLVGWLRPR